MHYSHHGPAETERTMKSVTCLPGDHLDAAKIPGHWLLLRLGKRVLRPGGLELTRRMLDGLNIQPDDDVVEFGPGLGVTARLTLARKPHSYVGIERDESAARMFDIAFKASGGSASLRVRTRRAWRTHRRAWFMVKPC